MDIVDRRVRQLRYIAAVVLSLFFLGGLSIGRVGVLKTWEAWQSSGWRTVSGVIVTSDTKAGKMESGANSADQELRRRGERESVSKDVWINQVTYSFEVDGKPFEGHRIAVGDVAKDNFDEARQVANRYVTGNSVTVHVHPEDPSRSVLEPGITFGAVGPLIIGTVLCFIATAAALAIWSKHFVSVVDGFHKPGGIYSVGPDGRLIPSENKRAST